MEIKKLRTPEGGVAVAFEATMVTRDGTTIVAQVVINANSLHYQMLKATRNQTKVSVDGPVLVQVTDVKEVASAL